jgi:hypothetical protein
MQNLQNIKDKDKVSMIKKIAVIVLLMIYNTMASAQTDPPVGNCDGTDIDEECPVPFDTWLYVLVIAAIVFGAYHLYKKHKALSA